MRVLINGEPVDDADGKHLRHLSVTGARDFLDSVVLDPAAIEAGVVTVLRWVYGMLAVFVVGFAIFILFAADHSDLPIIAPLAVLLIVGLGAFMVFMYRRAVAKTRAGIGPRLSRMASPGTKLRFDATGLTVAGQATAWASLGIDSVEITRVTPAEGEPTSFVGLLSLTAPGGAIVLDAGAMRDGRWFIDNVWRRLRPAS